MNRLSRIARSLRTQPAYTLMRGIARFETVRQMVAQSRRALHGERRRAFVARCEARMQETLFPVIDRKRFVDDLKSEGIAFGLQLPERIVASIRAQADRTPCYADRDPRLGFRLHDRMQAEERLRKPILLAQYFNGSEEFDAIAELVGDPLLQAIACDYLQSVPTFVGVNLWWTFPVQASEADRAEHAHYFHRDVDDFRFFKYFFYLTDVFPGEGAHVCVAASHRRPPLGRPFDRWNLRRYQDAEIVDQFEPDSIQEICGLAGTGFAENTLCVHKGRTPTTTPRLLLQVQYALFDYGAMHDRRDPAALASIA